ncbi:MAG: hypothetical protein K2X62_01555, partial [Beijerinckiaceae bacterium]|nr:hypothetical protein [Beijerinckiaceae bacterium]
RRNVPARSSVMARARGRSHFWSRPMEWAQHMLFVSLGLTAVVLVISGLFAAGEKIVGSVTGKK